MVTGGGAGIGAATAALFCANGAKVLLVDRDQDALDGTLAGIRAQTPGAGIASFVADVAESQAVAKAVRVAVTLFGGLDALVNNAAVRYVAPIAEADVGEWERLLQVNLLGALNCAQAALPMLRRAKGASIVNVASSYAVIGRPRFGAYDATKAALLAFTRTLAAEEAQHGIRVNAVCPGGTLTPFTIGRGAVRGVSENELRAQPKPDSLLKRWAEPIEVAYPILWLASSEASFVTGATLIVDGGTPSLG